MLEKYKKELLNNGETYFKIKARPSASKTQIKDILKIDEEDILKIDIAASATNNKANIELIDFIAKEFSVFKKNVKIISGAGAKLKLLKIKK